MSRTFVFPGEVLEIAAPADVSSGDPVVFGRQIGVALGDYANGALGRFSMEGVHELPAVDGAEFVAGQQVIWDSSAGAFDDHDAIPATGDVSVCCIAAETKTAGTSDTVKVKLNIGIGTVA